MAKNKKNKKKRIIKKKNKKINKGVFEKKPLENRNFEKIDNYNVDVNKKEDIERFVLSHIYYITQK